LPTINRLFQHVFSHIHSQHPSEGGPYQDPKKTAQTYDKGSETGIYIKEQTRDISKKKKGKKNKYQSHKCQGLEER
jgi:hypothetical protein